MSAELAAEVVAQLALEFYKSEALRLELAQLNEAVAKVSSSLDQLLTREIRAGFQALAEAQAARRDDIRDARLQFADHVFLLNANLDPRLQTNGEPNSRLISRSFQGLSIASSCRGVHYHYLASQYVLRAFEADPRFARTDLFPRTYAEFFAPCCPDIVQWFVGEKAKQEERQPTIRADIEVKTALATGVAVGISSLLPVVGPYLALKVAATVAKGVFTTEGNWIDIAVSRKLHELAGSLDKEFQEKIDRRCKEIAVDLLPIFERPMEESA